MLDQRRKIENMFDTLILRWTEYESNLGPCELGEEYALEWYGDFANDFYRGKLVDDFIEQIKQELPNHIEFRKDAFYSNREYAREDYETVMSVLELARAWWENHALDYTIND